MPSSVIRSTAYDAVSRTLSVRFVPSGRRYDYADVPAAVYDALQRAPSKGRYFNAFIRDHYHYRAAGPAERSSVPAERRRSRR